MMLYAAQSSGSGPTVMSKTAIVAALEREVSGLTQHFARVERTHEGRTFVFFEKKSDPDGLVVVCGGIGADAARRAAEAVIALYHPTLLHSVGFAGALNAGLHVGDIISPAVVIDARDGSRVQIEGGEGTLVTFMAVATAVQKANLAQSYAAQAVDMEASAVAAAACARNLSFSATKVISDGLHFEMPETARFIDAHGRFKTAAFALHVALRPWLWPRVVTLASNSSKAARSLAAHLKGSRHTFSDTVAHEKLKEIIETKTH
jgi:adenosylhomocysteine nucleosidase